MKFLSDVKFLSDQIILLISNKIDSRNSCFLSLGHTFQGQKEGGREFGILSFCGQDYQLVPEYLILNCFPHGIVEFADADITGV